MLGSLPSKRSLFLTSKKNIFQILLFLGYSSCPLGAASQSPPLPVIARTGGLTIGCFLSLQSYSWSGTISYFDHWWVLSLQSYSYSATIFNTLTIECSLALFLSERGYLYRGNLVSTLHSLELCRPHLASFSNP